MRKATSVKSKIFKTLSSGGSFTTKQLASKAKTSTVNVSRRVYDLQNEGVMVYQTQRVKVRYHIVLVHFQKAVIAAAGMQRLERVHN